MYRGFRATALLAAILSAAASDMVGVGQSSAPAATTTTGTAPTGLSELPGEQTVEYVIHEDPLDALSDVAFVVRMDLSAGEPDGAWIGWEVTAVEFRKPGTGGTPDTVWIQTHPYLDTADGLWWVEHADPAAPVLAEFDMPPWLLGTAAATDPVDADLDYDFEGVEYTAPPAPDEPPYAHTTGLAFAFVEQGSSEPLEESDEDEPVETRGVSDPV